jgi:hypothetical protein
MTGLEPVTSSLPRTRSTTELHRQPRTLLKQKLKRVRAGDEARTRDLQLGRLPLYQLSYSRIVHFRRLIKIYFNHSTNTKNVCLCCSYGRQSGGRRIRTTEGVRQQIYSLPHLTALVSPRKKMSQ